MVEKKKKSVLLVGALVLSIFLFYINFSFISNFYFNGDESFMIKILNSFMKHWNVKSFTGFYWKRAPPLFVIPFFFLFGKNLTAFRASQSTMMALAFFTSLYLAKDFYNRKTGYLLAFSLLVFGPFSLLLVNEYPFVIFLISLTLFTFVRWQKEEKEIYLYLLAFILGFGIFMDLTMIYTTISLLIGYLVLKGPNFSKWDLKKKHLFVLGAFLLGISPLIYVNISTDFYQLRHLLEAGLNPQVSKKYNNLNIAKNFREVLHGLHKTLENKGQYIGLNKNPWSLPVFYISLFFLALFGNKKDHFLLAFFGSFLFLLVFQPQWFKNIHISFLIIPLILIIIRGFYLMLKRPLLRPLGIILLVIFLISNVSSTYGSYMKFRDERLIEENKPGRAPFHIQAFKKIQNENTYFGDRIIMWHLSLEFPIPQNSKSKFLCMDLRKPKLGGGGIYGYTSGFECNFTNKISKNASYLFPTSKLMERVMGDAYYRRNTSIQVNGTDYYYPFYAFKNHLEKENMSLQVQDKIRGSQRKVMYRIYKIKGE